MMTRKRFNEIWEKAVSEAASEAASASVNTPPQLTNRNGMSRKLANRIIEAGREGRSLALDRSK